MDMAMRFIDIRKRVYTFPKMGEKAYFIAIPTSAGTGSEVTPFAVITDQDTGVKYPLADYQLMPKMAIVDADNMMSQPKGLNQLHPVSTYCYSLHSRLMLPLWLQITQTVLHSSPSRTVSSSICQLLMMHIGMNDPSCS